MIVARLMGGLGNQMFQYAAGLRLAKHHSTDFKLDLSWYDKQSPDAPALRVYELDCFSVSAPALTPQEAKLLPESDPKGLFGIMGKGGGQKLTLLKEKAYNFDSEVLKAPDNVLIEGYWQSEKYFEDVADAVKREFQFATKQDAKNAAISEQIKNSTAVSLHVRRGDYVSNENTNQFHGTSTLDYYKQAIDRIVKKLPEATFFIFSDEPEWCKENLHFDQPTVYVDANPPDKGFEDMRLMIQCQHHILANSSFSWWGAWLGQNPVKMVIAPVRWFNDPSIDTTDVIPARWEKI